jgi:N-acetyl-alpha-D-glucosaminyl L-malate synthase BshA
VTTDFQPCNLAILLHGSAGGSGVVATELGLRFAAAGCNVHFVADRVPFRLTELGHAGVFYHQVEAMAYPLFDHPIPTLAEASKLAEVIEEYQIDVIHAHYAIPHAAAAIMAREMVKRAPRPGVVTTLHGTDVTLVGLDKAYLRATQYSIERSDVVTAVSRYLAATTRREMGVSKKIQVIPNAVNSRRFKPQGASALRLRYAHPDEKLLIHISNFRPVKRVCDVVRVFAEVAGKVGSRLLMIGDGPERPKAVELAAELGVSGRVSFLGSFPRVEEVLAAGDLFLLPSATESFGLAALEAMASGLPVVASRVGGVPEVVTDGETGYLCDLGDVHAMAQAALRLLQGADLHARFARAARARAVNVFSEQRIVPLYAQAYASAVGRRALSSGK